MSTNIKRIALICATLAVLSGCSQRIVDFTIMSSKNIDLSRGAEFRRSTTRVKADDTKSIIILIPTGIPNMKTAMDKAIESVPGTVALLDGVVTSSSWYIPYIYGQSSITVEGTPLIDPKLGDGLNRYHQ